jgi:hypothetical protein
MIMVARCDGRLLEVLLNGGVALLCSREVAGFEVGGQLRRGRWRRTARRGQRHCWVERGQSLTEPGLDCGLKTVTELLKLLLEIVCVGLADKRSGIRRERLGTAGTDMRCSSCEFWRASERLAVRLHSICDRLVPRKRRRPSRRQIAKKHLGGHGGALFRAKEEWKQGSYRGAGSQIVRS